MAKIAIVDIMFYLPPGGGSHVEVREIALRLARHHEVEVFVPRINRILPVSWPNIDFILKKTKFFTRGTFKEPVNLKIVPIDFDGFSFNLKNAPKKFLEALRRFKPDHVLFEQGSFMKPHILNALSEFNVISRLFSNEGFCLKGEGRYHKLGKICEVDYLDNSFCSYLKCLGCATTFLAGYPSPVYLQEYSASMAFLPSHRRRLIESLKNPSRLLVYNAWIKNKLSRFNKNIDVVPGGVDFNFFASGSRLSNNDDKIKILMPCRSDDPTKGFDMLFNAAKKLWRKRKDFKILVTVRDKMPKKYRCDFICNLGWMSHKEIPNVYASSDIVAIPSQWSEPFGIAAVEGMAAAKPVIASRVGGLAGIVEDGKTGFLFDARKESELIEKLGMLLDDPLKRQEMGCSGREKARSQYDWEIVFEKYYKKLFL